MVQNEINIQMSLKHKNIVKLLETKEYNENIILLMEYLHQSDLYHFINSFPKSESKGKISEALCAYFMIQILDTLLYLRINHILHRDIKLANIMLDQNYQVKLGDFSLSRRINEDSYYMTSCSGTVSYLPPECVNDSIKITGEAIYKRDMFSLGVAMYFLLFNCHPFGFDVSFFNFLNFFRRNCH